MRNRHMESTDTRMNSISIAGLLGHRAGYRLLIVGIFSIIFGCGPKEYIREDRATLSGTVTFDDKPLPAGVMTLMSKENKQIRHNTMIDDGKFTTSSAPFGDLVITIETESIQFGGGTYVPIPARYNNPDESGLTAVVKPGEKNEVHLVLEK